MTVYRISDDSGVTRLVGTIDPDPGAAGQTYLLDPGGGFPVANGINGPFCGVDGVQVMMTSPPLVVAADSDILAQIVGQLGGLAALAPGGDYDLNVTVFVTDQDGTNTLLVSNGVAGPSADDVLDLPADWTGVAATIEGTDLTWTAATSTVHTTAGGVFTVHAVLHGRFD